MTVLGRRTRLHLTGPPLRKPAGLTLTGRGPPGHATPQR
jgi:hypothetical protein